MIYEIKNKYFIKRQSFFVEVDLVVTENDVILKPTNNKLSFNEVEDSKAVSFDELKSEQLKKHEAKKEEFEVKPKKTSFPRKNNYSSTKRY